MIVVRPVILMLMLAAALAAGPAAAATVDDPDPTRPADATTSAAVAATADATASAMARFDEAVRRQDTPAALQAAREAAQAARADRRLGAVERSRFLGDLGIRIMQEVGVEGEAGASVEELFQDVLEIRRIRFGEESAEAADSYDLLSSFHFLTGRYDAAEEEERRTIALREAILPPDDPAIALARDGLGTILVRQGRYAEAEPLLLDALATYRKAEPPEAESLAGALNTLAELARTRGDMKLAEERFTEGLSYAPGAPALHPQLLNNLAGLYKDQGRYAEAEDLLRHSQVLREAADPPQVAAVATALLNLAELARLQGKSAEAGPLYGRALEAARRGLGESNPDLAFFLNQAAVNAEEQGNLDEALLLNSEAITLLRGAAGGEEQAAQSLVDRGGMLLHRGRTDAALESLREALAIRIRALGEDHPETALARVALAQALAGAAGGSAAATTSGPGAAGPPAAQEARTEIDRALRVLDAGEAFPDERAEAHAGRARLRRAGGDKDGAIADLQSAATIVEDLRPKSGGGEAARAGRFARHAAIFDDLALSLFEAGRTADGFEASERGRGRALLDQLEVARVDLRDALPAEEQASLRSREQAALARLVEARDHLAFTRARTDLEAGERERRAALLDAELAEAARSVADLREEAQNRSPVWRRSGGATPTGLTTVQARLVPRRGFMLVYIVGPDRSGLLLVPPAPQRAEFHRLEIDPVEASALGIPAGPVGSEALARAVRPLLAALARPPAVEESDWQEDAGGAPGERAPLPARLHALWSALLPPAVWSRVHETDELIVLPDGPLASLPFEALVLRPAKQLQDSGFWIDEGPAIRYAPSAGIQRALADRPAGGTGLLSVADPAYTNLPRLPGTEAESRAVVQASRRKSLGASPAVVLEGAAATEAAVRASLPGKKFVHLAVHGKIEPRLGDLFASLALTPPGGSGASGMDGSAAPRRDASDDGALMLFEIYDLSLQAELAVLSACETSRGRIVEGEGAFALSRGFLAAGARRVVASLWSVDDASTAALMGGFFKRLGSGSDRSYAAALRDARRDVRGRGKWKAPFYWAPFLLTGAY